MTDEQQPELRWAPLPPRRTQRGRVWLIVGLVVATLLIAGALLFFLLPRGGAPDPDPTETPTPSATPSPTATASPTPSESAAPPASPEPTVTPVTTPPPVEDPSIGAFRDQVRGWLDDGSTGLDIVSESSGQDAVSVLDTMRDDAQRLADSTPPSSIAGAWSDGVVVYADALSALRSAVAGGSDSADELADARSALASLRDLVRL